MPEGIKREMLEAELEGPFKEVVALMDQAREIADANGISLLGIAIDKVNDPTNTPSSMSVTIKDARHISGINLYLRNWFQALAKGGADVH